MALILVMCLLVLMSALFVGYFSTITAERVSAKNFATNNETRLLAESAVNIVMAQIVDATTREPGTMWASQPGMIRTFDSSPKAAHAYKLYSSGKMVVKGGFNARAEHDQEVPKDWASRAGEFVDLNAPLRGMSGKRYPIVDPAAVSQGVEGFQPDPKSGVAMPVRWMYVLRDGRLTVGVPLGGGRIQIAESSPIDESSSENPVVGRIAFWTDDETCKVNINTASEGVFWEMPRTQSQKDLEFATRQPVLGEYQRFPGHPATVCLSTVFPDWVDRSSPHNSKIYAITPRIEPGGSVEGTVDVAGTTPTPGVTLDSDRLYASLDELLYNQRRLGNAGVSAEEVDRSRFFVTVSSGSPDLNLFNLPRVTLWPVHANPANWNPKVDALMALCSTLPGANNARFYFTRQEALSATRDFAEDKNNHDLYAYLQWLTSQPVPGFGGRTFAQKYGGDLARDQILTEIFDFVRCTNIADSYFPNSYYTHDSPGLVVPIEIGNTRGFGRFPTLSEAAIDFYATKTDSATGKVTEMKAALLLATMTPAQGYLAMTHPNYVIQVKSVKDFSTEDGAGNKTFRFDGDATILQSTNSFSFGGEEGIKGALTTTNSIPVSDGGFHFGGGDFTVTFLVNSQAVQTLTLSFPAVAATLSAPIFTATRSDYSNSDYFANDVVRSIELRSGDPRLIAGMKSVTIKDATDKNYFEPDSVTEYDSNKPLVFGLRDASGRYYSGAKFGTFSAGVTYAPDCQPKVRASLVVRGDWDNGVGDSPDGPYIGKADDGCGSYKGAVSPYYNTLTSPISSALYFSQRMLASPVALGSLSTGKPWQTLLFCPNPVAGNGHLGKSLPRDYLWLDLFTVPTVAPYALSEPLSASGRVNMNCELVPFTGIVRTTALRAALKSTKILAIPTGDGLVYKKGSPVPASYYRDISADETLKFFDEYFDRGEVFCSPAQICDIPLMPEGASSGSMATWWDGYALTGDNSREMPYNHLYPLLTTQSNTYTVYYRTQTLIKAPGTDSKIWEEGRDVISGEYRGSTMIERRIDPKDSRLKSLDFFAHGDPSQLSLTPFYRFRIISATPFIP